VLLFLLQLAMLTLDLLDVNPLRSPRNFLYPLSL
jgi:hypothetical protein